MDIKFYLNKFMMVIAAIVFSMGMVSFASADIYINVMVVNGTPDVKETVVNSNLPGDLNSQDIVETSGLDLEYNANDANYYVHGNVTLQPKETKTFRIRVHDVWKLTKKQIEDIKADVEEGYEQIGKVKDAQNGALLKEHLLQKLDFIVQEQSIKADSVEKRMDAYRAYSKELKRIEDSALDVDYWRSDPSDVKKERIVRFNVTATNILDKPKSYKHKNYLPSEIRPVDLVEFEGFEVRFDQDKKQVFLFKEEVLQPKEIKKYTIGIRDIWFVPQKEVDYLRRRSTLAYNYLKDTRYVSTAKILYDHIEPLLKDIENSQSQKRDNILEHISAFRDNQKSFDNAKTDVETLEKILSVFREDLDKSKVENILSKMQALKGIADVSKAVFNKKFEETTTWSFVSWILIFVAFITVVNFIVWFLRSKDKKASSTGDSSQQGSGEKKTS